MLNEWRSNVWLVVELFIVGMILWIAFVVLFGLLSVRMRHNGYDYTDVYVATIRTVDEDSPLYEPYDSAHSYLTDYRLLESQIRSNPAVEIVGGGVNSMPYQFNYYGNGLDFHDGDTTYTFNYNLRRMSPDVIRLMRLEGLNGESADELAEMIERGQIILGPADDGVDNGQIDARELRGKDVALYGDTANIVHVGAVAGGLRRSDYEPLYSGVAYMPLLPGDLPHEMLVRVRPGSGREFVESLTDASRKVGNVYINSPESMDFRREEAHRDTNNTIVRILACGVFLMLMIFMSFLATFWFRIQQRTQEIAVRRVNGATNCDILRRFISEGLLLLGCAVLLVIIPLGVYLAIDLSDEIYIVGFSLPVVWTAGGFTILLMALLVVLGIWPASRRAMKIYPAQALKDE